MEGEAFGLELKHLIQLRHLLSAGEKGEVIKAVGLLSLQLNAGKPLTEMLNPDCKLESPRGDFKTQMSEVSSLTN